MRGGTISHFVVLTGASQLVHAVIVPSGEENYAPAISRSYGALARSFFLHHQALPQAMADALAGDAELRLETGLVLVSILNRPGGNSRLVAALNARFGTPENNRPWGLALPTCGLCGGNGVVMRQNRNAMVFICTSCRARIDRRTSPRCVLESMDGHDRLQCIHWTPWPICGLYWYPEWAGVKS